jgi:hypothetical protein
MPLQYENARKRDHESSLPMDQTIENTQVRMKRIKIHVSILDYLQIKIPYIFTDSGT